jgi:hypothetical protein
MTLTVLAISAAYVVIAVLLLAMGLTSRFAWWIKASAIVLTSVFFIEAFFATKSLLGWPGNGRLPARFQLLWTRVVEPDAKTGDHGAVFLWVEEVDANNVPSGIPRAYQLPYSRPLADRSIKARDEIMSGNPQEGDADDLTPNDVSAEAKNVDLTAQQAPDHVESGRAGIVFDEKLNNAQHVQFRPMTGPLLPPKE